MFHKRIFIFLTPFPDKLEELQAQENIEIEIYNKAVSLVKAYRASCDLRNFSQKSKGASFAHDL